MEEPRGRQVTQVEGARPEAEERRTGTERGGGEVEAGQPQPGEADSGEGRKVARVEKEPAMAAVTNKTGKPLSIALPRGKTLHLGPRKSGQISSHDIEHPSLKKLVDAGAIEIVADDLGSTAGGGGGSQGLARTPPPTAGRG